MFSPGAISWEVGSNSIHPRSPNHTSTHAWAWNALTS